MDSLISYLSKLFTLNHKGRSYYIKNLLTQLLAVPAALSFFWNLSTINSKKLKYCIEVYVKEISFDCKLRKDELRVIDLTTFSDLRWAHVHYIIKKRPVCCSSTKPFFLFSMIKTAKHLEKYTTNA